MGGDIWVMPALGGSARRVAANGNFPSWTPDGARILFISGPWFGKKLYTVSAAGGTPEEIPLKLPPVNLLLSSSFSPNGRWILFEAMIQGASTVLAVARSGGDPRIIVRGRQPMWAADGASVVYTNDAAGSNYSLWEIPFSPESGTVAGPPRALTVGAGRDLATSASRDGTRIAFTKQSRSSNLELLPFDAEAGRELGPPTQLTSGMQSINFWSFSPDSKSIAFDAQRGGGSSLWRVGHDGAPVALTGDDRYVDTTPRWSPDGSSILFTRATANNPAVQSALWIMTADGAGPRLLVEGAQSPATQWTPDGKGAVYFRSGQLYAFDIASGRSRPLTDETRVMPVTAISPDGRWVVFQSTASGTVDLRAVP
jgi:Tol biopolymer transport system component